MPSLAYVPVTALSVAANDSGPSSASVTSHVAAGTVPLAYDAPESTPCTVTDGAVFVGAAALTSTLNVAGARLNVPSVVLAIWASETVALPCETGVSVSVFASPQDVKVTELGLTVATAALDDETARLRVVFPVRLHPCLPSPFAVITVSVVVPDAPPTVSGITSAVASTVASRSFEMSSATAAVADEKVSARAATAARVGRKRMVAPKERGFPAARPDHLSPQGGPRGTPMTGGSASLRPTWPLLVGLAPITTPTGHQGGFGSSGEHPLSRNGSCSE